MRPSWVEVDLGAIRRNAAALADAVRPAELCAVVKADAYGHGDVPVAEAALAGGATWLAVALVEEGIRLREGGIDAQILLLSEPPPDDVPQVISWSLTPTVYTAGTIEALDAAATVTCAVHLKVNTGMHRVGADPADVVALGTAIDRSEHLTLEGLYTHFPVADEDEQFTLEQAAALEAARAVLAGAGLAAPRLHAANTAGAVFHGSTRLDMVRAGLGLYGYLPVAPGAEPMATPADHAVKLEPALRVVSHVTLVRRLPAGARPSYGRRRPLARPATVATVPIGYADGISWRWLEAGLPVLIGGVRRPLAGSVTMDQLVVEVGDDPVQVGDEVVIVGSQGEEALTVDEIAGALGTISYEVLCRLGPRLPRRFLT